MSRTRAMSRSRALRFGLVSAWMLGLVAWSAPARADTVVGADLSYVHPFEDHTNGGYAVGLRLGQRLDLKLLTVTGELAGDYNDFGGALDPRVMRGMIGARAAVGAILRPTAFAHAGVGHLWGDQVAGYADSRTAFTFDLGLGLDLTIIPLVNLGVHLAYNNLVGSRGDGSLEWLTTGVHADLVLP